MEINLTSQSYFNLLGVGTMVAALPHRVSTLLADTQLVSEQASQVFKTIGQNKVYGGVLAGVGFGLSVYNAALAYDRICSGDGQEHVADYFVLASASFGALATLATLTPASIPLAGSLGLMSLALDVAGSLTMLVPSSSRPPVGSVLLQLGLTLFFGFDAHHYQVMGKVCRGQKVEVNDFFFVQPASQKNVQEMTVSHEVKSFNISHNSIPALRSEFPITSDVVVRHDDQLHTVVVRGIAPDPHNPGQGIVMTDLPGQAYIFPSNGSPRDLPPRYVSWTPQELRVLRQDPKSTVHQ